MTSTRSPSDNHMETLLKTTSIQQVPLRGVNFPQVVFHHSSERENERKRKKVNNLRLEGDLIRVKIMKIRPCTEAVELLCGGGVFCFVYACVPYSGPGEFSLPLFPNSSEGKNNVQLVEYKICRPIDRKASRRLIFAVLPFQLICLGISRISWVLGGRKYKNENQSYI